MSNDQFVHYLYNNSTNVWNQYEQFTLEYYYKDRLKKIIANICQDKSICVKDYEKLVTNSPRLMKERDVQPLVNTNVIYLRNSRELWGRSQDISESTKPVLIYYAWQQFFAFFIYTLFKWNPSRKHHGISCKVTVQNGQNILTFKIHEYGFFIHLIDTFLVLGKASVFGLYVPLLKNGKFHYVQNILDVRIQREKEMKITDILDVDPSRDYAIKFKRTYNDTTYSPAVDCLLSDFLYVFIASNLARYNPQIWREVLDGKTEDLAKFNMRYQKACRKFVEPTLGYMADIMSILARYLK